jgi:hypothetical protein
MSIFTFRPTPAKKFARPSAFDLVVARFAREHDEHVAPIVGCYLCLHNEPRSPRELLAAA